MLGKTYMPQNCLRKQEKAFIFRKSWRIWKHPTISVCELKVTFDKVFNSLDLRFLKRKRIRVFQKMQSVHTYCMLIRFQSDKWKMMYPKLQKSKVILGMMKTSVTLYVIWSLTDGNCQLLRNHWGRCHQTNWIFTTLLLCEITLWNGFFSSFLKALKYKWLKRVTVNN